MGRSWSRDEERAGVGASGSARETHRALVANGNLYCPTTPRTLLELSPLARDATPDQEAAHDQQTTELARQKLGKITSDLDPVGEEGVECSRAPIAVLPLGRTEEPRIDTRHT